MNVVGISAFYHDAAASIVRDGEIVAAAQEERFTRKKHDAGFPKHALDYCLSEAGVRLEDVDLVAFYDKPLLKFERLLETYLAFAPRGFASLRMASQGSMARRPASQAMRLACAVSGATSHSRFQVASRSSAPASGATNGSASSSRRARAGFTRRGSHAPPAMPRGTATLRANARDSDHEQQAAGGSAGSGDAKHGAATGSREFPRSERAGNDQQRGGEHESGHVGGRQSFVRRFQSVGKAVAEREQHRKRRNGRIRQAQREGQQQAEEHH